MKNKFLLFITLIGIMFILVVIKLPLGSYKEDVLYSDKIINNKAENMESKKYITREEVIKQVITAFDKGFGISVNRDELTENINLYEVNGEFQWSIVWMSKWSDNYGKERYYCEVLAENGVIKYIGKEKDYEVYDEEKYNIVDMESALNIIKPLAEHLNIDIAQCDTYFEKFDLGSRLVLKDPSKEVNHYFKINCRDKTIQTYYRAR